LALRNLSLAANQHTKLISEGSCKTNDWSNAENEALLSGIKLHLQNTLEYKNNFKLYGFHWILTK